MPSSISDRLKALGVKVGAQDIQSTRSTQVSHPADLASILGGFWLQTPQGEAFVVESRYSTGHPHGRAALQIANSLDVIASWSSEPRLRDLPPEAILFIDTETTGLSGGTGVYTFLIGAGRFIEGEFVLRQFLMPDPIEEPAQLSALEAFAAPCTTIVSFNGKAFDAPLINTRFLSHGLRSPLFDLAHLDLLHLARRLWRDRLPSRTLPNLEAHILGALRLEQDIPGWMIPQVYFDYLHSGDPAPLKQVLYHNAMDVLSLAALLDHMAALLNDPLALGGDYAIDLISLARLFEDLGDLELATSLYLHGLQHEDTLSQRIPRASLLQALQRLALIRKRQNDFDTAIQLWVQAADYHHIEAHIELAKCYEHQLKDIHQALYWTETALTELDSAIEFQARFSAFQRRQLRSELDRRQSRLIQKLSRLS